MPSTATVRLLTPWMSSSDGSGSSRVEEAYSGRNWNLRYREGSELDTLLEQGARVRHGLRQKKRQWRREERHGQQEKGVEKLLTKGEQRQTAAEHRVKNVHHATSIQRTAQGSAQDVGRGEADASLASGFASPARPG